MRYQTEVSDIFLFVFQALNHKNDTYIKVT